jgi:ABC-2 type transport system permease protein
MQKLRRIVALSRFLTVRYLRDKTALFFTFAFPLIFLVVFGGIFGSDNGPSFDVALINRSTEPFSEEFVEIAAQGDFLNFQETEDFEVASEQLGRGEFSAIVELPEGFGALDEEGRPSGSIITYVDEADQQQSAAFSAVMQGLLDGVNAQFIDVDPPPLAIEQQSIQTANLTQFDYILAGLIGFSILTLGIFSMTEGFAVDKKNGALKRLRVAPIEAWQLIIATAISRVLVGILTVAVMFIVAVVFFDFNMRGDYLSFGLFTILSTICLFGFGMAIAGWAKDGNQAAPLSNLVAFPMMFLSGVFFPRFLMPDFLQAMTFYLPLTPVVDGLRLILTEGSTILQIGPQLAVIGAWIVIIYTVAFKVFRWD